MTDVMEQAKQFIRGGVRGATADVLGAPVDIINMLLQAVDASKVLPQRFSTDEPVGGSKWIHRRLRDAGLAWDETGSGNENVGRLLGGLSVTPGNIGRAGAAMEDFAKARGDYYASSSPFKANAVKEPGGMWHPAAAGKLSSNIKFRLSGMGADDMMPAPDMAMPGEVPQYDWADRAVKNYLNKYAGTTRDPIKDVVLPSGNRWEDVTDAAIQSRDAVARNPEFATNPDLVVIADDIGARPGERVWDIHRNLASELRSYMSHVGDYLRQNVPPARLQQYDLTRAVRETAANDARVAAQMEKAAQQSLSQLPAHKEYPDGMRWVELKKPDKLTPEQAGGVRLATEKELADFDKNSSFGAGGYDRPDAPYVAVDASGKPIINSYTSMPALGGTPEEAWLAGRLADEGNQMGHCVGGYCDDVVSGGSRIYSLRDAKGRSHVTVETTPHGNEMRDGVRVPTIESISQIKGKQNRAPNAEYLPYVQDFVRSGQWGDIGDLGNTGLIKIPKSNQQAVWRAPTEYEYLPINDPEVRNTIREAFSRRFIRDRVSESDQADVLRYIDQSIEAGSHHNIQHSVDKILQDIIMTRGKNWRAE